MGDSKIVFGLHSAIPNATRVQKNEWICVRTAIRNITWNENMIQLNGFRMAKSVGRFQK